MRTGRKIISQSLGVTALAIRNSINEQGTLEQMDALEKISKNGRPLFGHWNSFLVVFTNWTKGDFFNKDFSGAIVGNGECETSRGRPSYMHNVHHVQEVPFRNVFTILGRDGEGNYWLSGRLRKGIWGKVERSFRETEK